MLTNKKFNHANGTTSHPISPTRRRLRVECRSCGRVLSRNLDLRVFHPNERDGEPFVQPGSWTLSDGSFFSGANGKPIINVADVRNMRAHPDPSRHKGCCGRDGFDGPNRLCECGAEVATEKSDCWMPHALIFEPTAVRIVGSD